LIVAGLVGAGILYRILRLIHRAFRIEPFNIEVSRHEVAYPDLPPELDGITLCQLSDLHIGPRPLNEAAIAQAVRSIHADLFLFTGDMIRGRSGPADFLRWLDSLGDSARPAVAIFGNAEHKKRLDPDEI